MPIKTPFDAVISVFATRLEEMAKFAEAAPALKNDPQVGRFGYQWLLVAYWSFLQELYAQFLFFAALKRANDFRDFVKRRTDDRVKRKELATWNEVRLAKYARQGADSMDANAKKLRGYCRFLFDAAPFPNDDAERLVTDLYKVRNIVVHQGGVPEKEHFKDVRTPGLVVLTNRIGLAEFYRLNLDAQTVVNFVYAGGLVVRHLDATVKAHPKLSSTRHLSSPAGPAARD